MEVAIEQLRKEINELIEMKDALYQLNAFLKKNRRNWLRTCHFKSSTTKLTSISASAIEGDRYVVAPSLPTGYITDIQGGCGQNCHRDNR